MYPLILSVLALAQASGVSDPSSEDIGRTATECAAFYNSFGTHVAKTEKEKQTVTQMQKFMTILAKENGTSKEEFVQIWFPYQRELERQASEDAAYVQSEINRCGEFAKREAKKREASTLGGG